MAAKFPRWNGSNHGDCGLVRRMTRSSVGGFAALRVVEDLDDEKPAAAGWNLLGQVVSVLALSPEERVRFAKLANTPRAKQTTEEKAEEGPLWARCPRLTAPGLDIDPRKEVKGTRRGREAAEAIARRMVELEQGNGIALRAAYSGGPASGAIHLDWRWDGSISEVHLLRALRDRVAAACAKAGVPTSDTKKPEDLAWVDLAPLNHAVDNRGRLWRPLGGKHKTDGKRKVLIGWELSGRCLAREDLDDELAAQVEERAERRHLSERKRSRRSPLETVTPIVPARQAELGELRNFIAGHRALEGDERQRQRMAWAAALLLDGIRVADARWVLGKAIGNARACQRIVDRTRELIESGSEGHPGPARPYLSKPYLEKELGTKVITAYAEALARVKTKEQEAAGNARDAAGGLRALVRSVSGLSRKVKQALVAHSELLREVDPEDPACGGLLRPSICRSIHEVSTCSLCKGERGRRRIACEDELCAWCHGSRVLHEHDLALQRWTAAGVERVAILSVYGFQCVADVDAWVREQALPRQGVKLLKVRTLRYVAAEPEGAGGAIEHGVLLVTDGRRSWDESCLRGSYLRARGRPDHEPTGLEAEVTSYTTSGGVEAIARARWATHLALREAATGGEVELLAEVLRDTFRKRAASSGKEALSWPGRTDARESIAAEVAARREEEEAAEVAERAARGEAAPRHGEAGHKCEGCPAPFAHPEHHLMSSGRPDAHVVHTQRWRHTPERAWRLLEQDRALPQRVARAERTAAEAAARRRRAEELERVPF